MNNLDTARSLITASFHCYGRHACERHAVVCSHGVAGPASVMTGRGYPTAIWMTCFVLHHFPNAGAMLHLFTLTADIVPAAVILISLIEIISEPAVKAVSNCLFGAIMRNWEGGLG